MDDRTKQLSEAEVLAQLRNRDARNAQRARKARDSKRQWQVLEEAWFEAVFAVHGKDHKVIKWGAPERMLARKVIEEAKDLDQAVSWVTKFIREWCPKHDKYPSMRFFWAIRGQLSAELGGTVQTKRQKLDIDEYDSERAKKFPAVGWGDE